MDIELNYQLIGKRLRTLRKNKRLTQEKVAELTNLSPQHISGIERGTAPLSLPALVRLCNALKATPDDVLFDSVPVAATPGLMREVEIVFSDATADEIYLMLAQAKSIKEAVRVKGLFTAR